MYLGDTPITSVVIYGYTFPATMGPAAAYNIMSQEETGALNNPAYSQFGFASATIANALQAQLTIDFPNDTNEQLAILQQYGQGPIIQAALAVPPAFAKTLYNWYNASSVKPTLAQVAQAIQTGSISAATATPAAAVQSTQAVATTPAAPTVQMITREQVSTSDDSQSATFSDAGYAASAAGQATGLDQGYVGSGTGKQMPVLPLALLAAFAFMGN